VFELDGYKEERNYIFVVRKLEMHRNQKTSYGVNHQVDDWKMSI